MFWVDKNPRTSVPELETPCYVYSWFPGSPRGLFCFALLVVYEKLSIRMCKKWHLISSHKTRPTIVTEIFRFLLKNLIYAPRECVGLTLGKSMVLGDPAAAIFTCWRRPYKNETSSSLDLFTEEREWKREIEREREWGRGEWKRDVKIYKRRVHTHTHVYCYGSWDQRSTWWPGVTLPRVGRRWPWHAGVNYRGRSVGAPGEIVREKFGGPAGVVFVKKKSPVLKRYGRISERPSSPRVRRNATELHRK